MTYCVQCGTKVNTSERYCNICSIFTAVQNQNSKHVYSADYPALQIQLRQEKNEIGASNNHPNIFIYVAIIVTYFLLTLGLWIHKNHQARISPLVAKLDNATYTPQSKSFNISSADLAEKKLPLSNLAVSSAPPKRNAKSSTKHSQPSMTYPLTNTEYFQPPFMLELLKKNDSIHEQAPQAPANESKSDNESDKTYESSDGLLHRFITSITKHGGQLPCSEVEKLMNHCH